MRHDGKDGTCHILRTVCRSTSSVAYSTVDERHKIDAGYSTVLEAAISLYCAVSTVPTETTSSSAPVAQKGKVWMFNVMSLSILLDVK